MMSRRVAYSVRVQLLCVWAGPTFLILYLTSFGAIAGWLPPHPPTWTPADVATFYTSHRLSIEAGQLLCLIFSTLLFPWFAVISVQMARIEGRFPVLAVMQFGGGVLLVVFFQLCSMLWIAASYRAELDPAVVRALHDMAWLTFVMVFPAYTLQLICIATAGFMDDREIPWLPKWACFFNLWIGVSGAGGAFAVFFKTGPFAWDGVIGFWMPVVMFAAWLLLMTPLLIKSIKRQEIGCLNTTSA